MNLILFSVIFAILSSAPCQASPRWCVISKNALERCNAIRSDVSKKDPTNVFSCVLGTDEKDCYKKIASKKADFGVFDSGMIYHAGLEHDMRVFMAEKLSGVTQPATSYYAVAVVKNTSSLTINNIKGKKSCHTGVQKTSGWKIPVGTLISKGIMKWRDCNQYATVADFFSSSCAPGASKTKYNPDLRNASKLCALCSGAGSNKCARSNSEPYYSYEGAFKCLKDGKGDVAFIKASTVRGQPDKANYKLLCRNGSTADPDDYMSCNFARVSSHAFLTRKDAPIATYKRILTAADKNYGEKSSSSLKLYKDGVLFSKTTVGLSDVAPENQTYSKYLDTPYIQSVKVLQSCARWCVTPKSMSACQAIANKVTQLACVSGASETDCYKKIAQKGADVGMFDGGDIYHAGKDYGLKVIMSENLKNVSTPETSYYAVAVVKKGSSLTINSLKGKKSCHTGVRKTSGWIVPIGHLLRTKKMSWSKDCSEYASAANFFNSSCAPGAKNSVYNKNKAGADKLCSLCAGTGNNTCVRGKEEPYYGYSGAFQCLKDGKGDVAFVKQSTVLESPSNFQLLCKDGTKKDPKDYKVCNLARVPSHAMLTRSDAPIAEYKGIFYDVWKKLGGDLFKPPGTLFSKNTVTLENVTAAKHSYKDYLDNSYMNDLAQFDSCTKASSSNLVHLRWSAIVFLWAFLKLLV